MKAVFQLDWNAKCEFAEETRLFLNNDSFSDWFDGLDQIEELTGKLVIDNTPLPDGGAQSDNHIAVMMTITTQFEMMYNIKHLAIYCGLACLVLLFIAFGQIYLYCKLRRDTNRKKATLAEEYDCQDVSTKLLPKLQ